MLKVKTRSDNTRMAYVRAACYFLNWCEGQGIRAPGCVQSVHLAAYIEILRGKRSAPTVKQHPACIRVLFDCLAAGQVMPTNPAHSVRGLRHSVTKRFNAGPAQEEATSLLTGINVSDVVASAP